MPNLTGVSLQRAIAEKKGCWSEFAIRIDGLYGRMSRSDGSTFWDRVPDWHDEIDEASALLDELVGKGDGDPIVITINCDGSTTITFGDKSVDADDFCTAVGNLYLECVQ